MRQILHAIAFIILAVVVGLRPLVAESYDSAGNTITQALQAIIDPSPLRTLVFDLMILAAAAMVFIGRFFDRHRPFRWTGLELGLAVLVLAGAVSCYYASQQRLAFNATLDWLCLPIMAIALVQLMDTPGARRMLLAIVVASAVAQAAQCFDQYCSHDDNYEDYLQLKQEGFWEAQGVAQDSPKIELFERRMRSADVQGFLPHGGVAGSYLVLTALIAGGVFVQLFRKQRVGLAAVMPALAVVAIGGAAILTHSRGALLAGVAGLLLWAVFARYSRIIVRHRRTLLMLAWGAFLGGSGAAIGHGVKHGSLPGTSLTFRWHYWQGSAQMIRDHLLTGVGRENFGRHYLQYKPAEAPEEIATPHNMFVQAATDWGVFGFVGLGFLVFGGSLAITGVRPRSPGRDEETRGGDDLQSDGDRAIPAGDESGGGDDPVVSPRVWLYRAAAIGIVIVVARIPLLDSAQPDFMYYSTVLIGLAWVAGLAMTAPFLARHEQANPDHSPIVLAIGVGVFAFLVHDLINFALFVPATATTLFAVFALGVAERPWPAFVPQPPRRSPVQWVPASLLLGIAVVAVLLGIWPVACARHSMELAKQKTALTPTVDLASQPTSLYLKRAAEQDPLDSSPYLRLAHWAMGVSAHPQLSGQALDLAINASEDAIPRDYYNLAFHSIRTSAYQARAQLDGQPADYLAAVQSARQALHLYPSDPRSIIVLARCLIDAGERLGDQDMLSEAAEHLVEAVRLDSGRYNYSGEVRRLTPGELDTVDQLLTRARATSANSEPTTTSADDASSSGGSP